MRTYSHNHKLVKMKREQIALGAARLMTKKGYLQTTTREIAAACKMSNGSLYHYVASKEDILSLILKISSKNYDRLLVQSRKMSVEKKPREALTKIITRFYNLIDKLQDFHVFWYQEIKNVSPSMRKDIFEWTNDFFNLFEKLIKKGNQSGDFDAVDPAFIANHIIAAGETWAIRRWFVQPRFSIDQYIAKEIELIMSYLKCR